MGNIGTPLFTMPDGNCAYNSISILLYGTDYYAPHLRVLTCIKLCQKAAEFQAHPDANEIGFLSPIYEDACLASARDKDWGCAWTLMALADVVGQNIKTIYPPVHGKDTLMYRTMNTTFRPISSTPSRTLTVMWTHTLDYDDYMVAHKNNPWQPNHFVAMNITEKYSNSRSINQLRPKSSSSVLKSLQNICSRSSSSV